MSKTKGITLERAIEVLEDMRRGGPQHQPWDMAEALALGIEAMKRIQRERRFYDRHGDELPGETEDHGKDED